MSKPLLWGQEGIVIMKNFPRILLDYMRANIGLYMLLSVFLILGIISGSIAVNTVSDTQTSSILNFINSFFSNVNNIPFEPATIFYLSLSNNFKMAILIIILGFTGIGIPLIFGLVFFRGFVLGFTVGFFVGELGIKGILFSLLSILPQNLIIIPSILSIAVAGLAFSITIIKNRGKLYPGDYSQMVTSYLAFNLFFCILLVMSGLVEGYISPFFIKLFTYYI